MTTLAHWTLGLAVTLAGAGILAALWPTATAGALARVPRGVWAGRVLSALALGWAALIFYRAPFEFLLPYREWIPRLAPVMIVAAWFLMEDLLACRATGGLLVLLPTPILAAVRLHASDERLIMAVTAYAMVVLGMTLLMSPYWMRRAVTWLCAQPGRVRATGGGALVAGLGFLWLALGVY